jgi:hypothetical protein
MGTQLNVTPIMQAPTLAKADFAGVPVIVSSRVGALWMHVHHFSSSDPHPASPVFAMPNDGAACSSRWTPLIVGGLGADYWDR